MELSTNLLYDTLLNRFLHPVNLVNKTGPVVYESRILEAGAVNTTWWL